MFRLFSIKSYLKCLGYLCLLFIINRLLFIIYPKDTQIRKGTPRKIDSFYGSFALDTSKEQGLSQYFERKRQRIRRTLFKTVIRNAFPKSSKQTTFLIYEYTRHRQFCKKPSRELIYVANCPYRNCQFTCNSNLSDRADAVLMLYSSLNYQKLFNLNVHRNPNQIWLLWHDEPHPPLSIYNKFLFNWTISYRLDSEISVAAYGITFIRDKSMDQSVFNKWINENYEKRSNEAVWFVSNCRPKERLQYYEQLKEHFSISAFGMCIVNQTNNSRGCTHRSQCELEKLSTSKFYLAFESTRLRRDYITEKFWRSLSLGVIPIVLGPKHSDYERVAPPNSFIYAKDYSSPQTLAKHLNDVVTNQNEYEKYHRWRIHYETRHRGQDLEPVRFCELCYQLNTNTDRTWYTDLNKYFSETD